MNTAGLTLLIPEKGDIEREAVARAFEGGGGTVLRLGRFWEPPPLDAFRVRVYGPEAFCLVLQQKLGLTLCSPADDLLLSVPIEFLGRNVSRQNLSEADTLKFPLFIKPLVPKQFRAAVFESPEMLRSECRGLDERTELVVSDLVGFVGEVRTFVLDKKVS
jgi:hypothetical protein